MEALTIHANDAILTFVPREEQGLVVVNLRVHPLTEQPWPQHLLNGTDALLLQNEFLWMLLCELIQSKPSMVENPEALGKVLQ